MGILRTILAIAVVVYHSYKIFGLRMCGGQVAVESFYMISGFYMALILNEKYTGEGSYKKFILSRFIRIFPVYWLVLAIVVILSVILYLFMEQPLYLGRYIANYNCLSMSTILFFVFENIVVLGQELLYFLKLDELCSPQLTYHVFSFNHTGYQYLFVPQAWSISLEFVFYIIAPFLVTKAVRWQIALIILGIGAKIFFANTYYLSFDPWTYRFFPFELPFFLAGSIAYRSFKSIEKRPIPKYFGTMLLVICILLIFIYDNITIKDEVKSAVFYCICLISLPFIFREYMHHKMDRYIGELSFSIYISHHVIVSLMRGYFFSKPELIPYYGYSVVIASLLLAIVFQHTIISRIEVYRHQKIS